MSSIDAVRLYSVKAAAELLSLSTMTVRRRIDSGELRAVHVGGGDKPRFRVRADDLQEYIDQHTFDYSSTE